MTDQVNMIIKSALDSVSASNPNVFAIVTRPNMEAELQTAFESIIPNVLTLNTAKPDFEAILLQFVQDLQVNKAWKDILPTQAGTTLLRDIAAGIAFLHNAIVRTAQINFLQPGTPKSSVYTTMASLGINPRRKIPAKIETKLTIPDHNNIVIIPKYTQFVIKGVQFFNRQEIVYDKFDLVKTVTLYQGSKFSQYGSAAGINYETIEIGYENYAISNEDVYVFINDKEWFETKTMIWNMPNRTETFFTSTLSTGNIQIKFGNDAYGKKLNAEDNIEIVWFETMGGDAPTIISDVVFDFILPDGMPVLAVTTSSSSGGDNELDTDFYINTGPFLRSSEYSAVTRNQYSDVACKYPGVRDALFRFQAEIAPNKRNWMNVAEATVLMSNGEVINENTWVDFVDYMQNNSIYQLEFIRRNILVISVTIKGKVHCSNRSILNDVKVEMKRALLKYTEPQRGVMGRSLYGSECISILEGSIENTLIPNVAKFIEFVTDFSVEYHSSFDPTTLVDNTGINADGKDEFNVSANPFTYIRIVEAGIESAYTPPRSTMGRRDMLIGSSSTSTINDTTGSGEN